MDASVDHGGPPQGLAERGMVLQRLLQQIRVDRADEAVRQRLHFERLCRSWHQKAVETEEITRIVEGVDLARAVLMPGGHACRALQQQREMLASVHRTEDGFAAVYVVSKLY